MNEKEVAEIRRRFRPDKSSITHIRGCYVNEKREIVSEFVQSLALTSQEDSEKFLTILKKTLTGTLDKNLINIEFATQQVIEGEEHKLLMALRSSSLGDDTAIHALFQKIILSAAMEGSYLIMLAHDAYDVPYRSKDGYRQNDASDETFSYILCSICPVKMTKPALSYFAHSNEFKGLTPDCIVSAPELGFMFPAFDDRRTNIYNALFYSRDISGIHDDFIEAVFKSKAPMPAAVQKEVFQSILGDAMEKDCDYGVVQAVQEHLGQIIAAHKENKVEDPLIVNKGIIKAVLEDCGVDEAHVNAFDQKYDEEFGPDTNLSPKNIVDVKLEVSTPDVVIQVNPERGDLVGTRVIDGKKYILIRAEEGVEVNGVPVHI